MNKYHKTLASSDVKILDKHFEVFTFPQEFTLIYEHHIPFSGVILVDGIIELRKRTELVAELNEPLVLGMKQYVQQKALRVECFIRKNARLILLSRHHLTELKFMHPELHKILLASN